MRSAREGEPNRFSHPYPTSGVSDPVDAWKSDLTAASRLTGPIAERIIATHGDRGVRAIEAVTEDRVKQYRDFTVVVGHREEYIVESEACTCADSEYNLDPEDPAERCWHALAVAIAEATGRVDRHDMWYSEVREFL